MRGAGGETTFAGAWRTAAWRRGLPGAPRRATDRRPRTEPVDAHNINRQHAGVHQAPAPPLGERERWPPAPLSSKWWAKSRLTMTAGWVAGCERVSSQQPASSAIGARRRSTACRSSVSPSLSLPISQAVAWAASSARPSATSRASDSAVGSACASCPRSPGRRPAPAGDQQDRLLTPGRPAAVGTGRSAGRRAPGPPRRPRPG